MSKNVQLQFLDADGIVVSQQRRRRREEEESNDMRAGEMPDR